MKRAFLALSLVASTLLATTFTDISPNSSTHTLNTPVSSADVTFTWSTPTVTDSTLAGYYYKIDSSADTLVNSSDSSLSDTATSLTKTLSDGTYYLHIAPYAANGDIGATKHFGPIIVDTTAPATVTITPDTGTYTSAQTITMSSSDANNFSIYYTTDGNDPTTSSTKYSSSFTVSSTKTIKAKACDVAGNCSGVSSVTLTINLTTNEAVVETDVDGKTIATSPTSNSKSKIPQITITGSSSLTHYKYKFDTGTYSAQTAVSTPIDISTLSEGTHTLYVIGYDGTTWQSEANPTKVTFTVDNTAPSDVTFNPTSGSTITGTSSATITLTSNGAKTIYYTTDGSVPTTSSSTGSSISLSTSNNGSLTVKAFSVDEAGNQSDIQTATYTVNISAPTTTTTTTSSSSSSYTTTATTDETTETEDQAQQETDQVQEETQTEQEVTTEEQTTQAEQTTDTEIVVTEIDTGVTKEEPAEIKIDGDIQTATTKFVDDKGEVIETTIESKLQEVEVVEKDDGTVEATATINQTDRSLELTTTINPNGTSEATLSITKDDGTKEDIKVAVAVVGADTTIEDDGSIKVNTQVTADDNTKATTEITAKTDGTVEAGLIIEKTDGTITKVDVIAEVEGADATIDQNGNLKVNASLENATIETTAKTDGTVDSNIKVTDTNGNEIASKVVANIPDSDVNIKQDGTIEVTTPTIKLENKKVAVKTVAKPTGEVKPVITIESDGATKEVELPEFDAGSQVEVKQTVDGKVVIETTTAPMPKNKEIIF